MVDPGTNRNGLPLRKRRQHLHAVVAALHAAETSSPAVQVGTRLRATVKSLLPYRLSWDCEVSRVEPPSLIEVETHVSLGERFRLTGPVTFRLSEQLGLVEVLNQQIMSSELLLPPG